jgi:transcriptional regulator with XRE-family HTH domain
MSEGDPDLAEQLREAIRRSGQSQRDLARRAKINQAQLSRFLNGKRTLTLDAAGALCAVLGLRLAKAEGSEKEVHPGSVSVPIDRAGQSPPG